MASETGPISPICNHNTKDTAYDVERYHQMQGVTGGQTSAKAQAAQYPEPFGGSAIGDTTRTAAGASAGYVGGFGLIRPATPAEQAEQDARRFAEQAERAQRAAAFFARHPAFSDFIQLIREGVIKL